MQSRIAQLETPSKSVTNEIVQLGIAQLEEDLQPLPRKQINKIQTVVF